jgi:threonine synthase
VSDIELHARCAGCGAEPEGDRWACPRAGDGGDHVLEFVVSGAELPRSGDPNPFVRFRQLSAIYWLARRRGLGDPELVDRIGALDARVAASWGHGFRITPHTRDAELGAWVKDETGNVAGSHKARHLFGLAVHLEANEAAGGAPPRGPLAIASCGNAALAAAVVARAAERPLVVFLPDWADEGIARDLGDLGAELVVCARDPGDPPGDPCVRRFRAAVAGGAVPFSCQGPDNGLTIDGGKTLGWEIAAQTEGALDRIYVQVGGGALASAVWQGLEQAASAGALLGLPALHPVQAEGCQPLVRAVRAIQGDADPAAALERGRGDRATFMKPWTAPASAASGILDDETYDWWQIARGVVTSGGAPAVAAESDIAAATDRLRATGLRASATGAAGYAGFLADGSPAGAAVIVTGVAK